MSHFQHLTCILCSIVKMILVYEMSKSLLFVFISISHCSPAFFGIWEYNISMKLPRISYLIEKQAPRGPGTLVVSGIRLDNRFNMLTNVSCLQINLSKTVCILGYGTEINT